MTRYCSPVAMKTVLISWCTTLRLENTTMFLLNISNKGLYGTLHICRWVLRSARFPSILTTVSPAVPGIIQERNSMRVVPEDSSMSV